MLDERKGKILALDIGTKRTGIAISDESRTFSLPRTKIVAHNKKEWIEQIKAIVEEDEVSELLVGLPLNQDGEEGQDAQNIRPFIALLRERLSLPVIEWDERFTTVQAERMLISADLSRAKRKEVIDKVAATIILQSYLDSLRFQNPPCQEDLQ